MASCTDHCLRRKEINLHFHMFPHETLHKRGHREPFS